VTDFFAEEFSAIDMHDEHICGLTKNGGQVLCLVDLGGQDPDYQVYTQADFGPGYREIVIMSLSNGWGICARTAEGMMKCNHGNGYQFIQRQFQHISMRDELICGVDDVGQIRCNDGDEDFVESILQPMNRLGPYTKLSVWRPSSSRGNPKTNLCALNTSGLLSCRDVRGRDQSYVVDAQSTLRNVAFSDFVMGQASGCGLTMRGGVRCLGWDFFGQVANAPEGDGFVNLTAGAKSYCATKADGTANCWGENYSTFQDSLKYVALSPESTGTIIGLTLDDRVAVYTLVDRSGSFQQALASFSPQGPVALATNLNTLCALSAEGQVNCAGNRGLEISGLESLQSHRFVSIFVDQDMTVCGLTTQGKVACAGEYFIPLHESNEIQ
jgi:hypothetical protein